MRSARLQVELTGRVGGGGAAGADRGGQPVVLPIWKILEIAKVNLDEK